VTTRRWQARVSDHRHSARSENPGAARLDCGRAVPRCPIVPREQGQEPDEAGRVDLDRSTFSLPEVLGHALTLVRGPASRYGVGLSLEVERGVGAVTADKRKVTQP